MLSGRDLIGLPGCEQSVYCDRARGRSHDLTSWPELELYHLTRHDRQNDDVLDSSAWKV